MAWHFLPKLLHHRHFRHVIESATFCTNSPRSALREYWRHDSGTRKRGLQTHLVLADTGFSSKVSSTIHAHISWARCHGIECLGEELRRQCAADTCSAFCKC